MKQSEALDMITKIQLAHQAMESACKRVDELKEENKNLKAALAKQEQGEPWGACVSGRVFVGALPEHVRKLSEDEGLPIQWLYTTPQQRKPLSSYINSAKINATDLPHIVVEKLEKAIEAAHGIKEKNT